MQQCFITSYTLLAFTLPIANSSYVTYRDAPPCQSGMGEWWKGLLLHPTAVFRRQHSTSESKRSRVAAWSKIKAKLYWSRVKANIKQVNTLTEDEDRSVTPLEQ